MFVSSRRRTFPLLGLALLALFSFPGLASAGGLPAPTGKVVLTIRGDIARTNAEGEARFDLAMIEAMAPETFETWTPYTEGTDKWRGVKLAALLDHVGANGTRITATALNDYAIEFPLADARTHDMLVAVERNGRPMRVREKGPAWIIYDWARFPEYEDAFHLERSIWQLTSIEVR